MIAFAASCGTSGRVVADSGATWTPRSTGGTDAGIQDPSAHRLDPAGRDAFIRRRTHRLRTIGPTPAGAGGHRRPSWPRLRLGSGLPPMGRRILRLGRRPLAAASASARALDRGTLASRAAWVVLDRRALALRAEGPMAGRPSKTLSPETTSASPAGTGTPGR